MTVHDIVARLRESDGGYHVRQIYTEAADEIERLRAEVDDLRKFRLDVMREAINKLPPVGARKEATDGSR